jgi:hypothetical protein
VVRPLTTLTLSVRQHLKLEMNMLSVGVGKGINVNREINNLHNLCLLGFYGMLEKLPLA